MARAAMLLKSIPGSEMQHTIKKYSLLNLGWCFCDILGFLQIAIHPIQMWCTTIWWKVAKSFVFVSFLGCVLGSVPPRPSNIQFVGTGTARWSTHRDQRKASAPQMPLLFLSNIQIWDCLPTPKCLRVSQACHLYPLHPLVIHKFLIWASH